MAEAEPEGESLVRELLILLLQQGLHVNVPFNTGRHPNSEILVSDPVGKAIHDRRDPALLDAMLNSNAEVRAHYAIVGQEDGPGYKSSFHNQISNIFNILCQIILF